MKLIQNIYVVSPPIHPSSERVKSIVDGQRYH